MILKNLKGVEKRVSEAPYLVKWDNEVGSKAQTRTKQFFKSYWINDRVCEEFRIVGTLLRIDLINFSKKIAVETSGKQHEQFNKFFHRNRMGFLNSIKRDFKKIQWLEINGFTLVEIYDTETSSLTEKWVRDKFGDIF